MPNFHNQKRPNQHQIGSQFQRHDQNISLATLSTLMTPLSSLKSLQINHQASQHFRQPSTNFQSNEQNIDIPSTNSTNSSGVNIPQHNILQQQQQQQQHHHQHQQQKLASTGSLVGGVPGISGKRKRSWSRAVFSNLQRKGLEIQFQQQKYITKPDRRKLAARLNLTDAQVKVWFQNRRMKWRHTRENLKTGQEKQINSPESRWEKDETRTLEAFSEAKAEAADKREFDYLTDASSSVEMSDNEDDDEIDVVE